MEKEWRPLPPPKVTRRELAERFPDLMRLGPQRRDEVCERAVMLGVKEGWCRPYVPLLGRLARDESEAYYVKCWLRGVDALTAKPKARETEENETDQTENGKCDFNCIGQ